MIKVNTIAICIIAALILLFLYRKTLSKKRVPASQKRGLLLLLIYMVAIYGVSFWNFTFAPYDRPRLVNLVPLVNIMKTLPKYGVATFAFNLLVPVGIFVPLGIILPAIFKNMNNWFKTAFCALLLTATVETLQWVFNTGVLNVDDLILNTLGTTIGFIIFRKIRGGKKEEKKGGKAFKFNIFTVCIVAMAFAIGVCAVTTVAFFGQTISTTAFNKSAEKNRAEIIGDKENKQIVYLVNHSGKGMQLDMYKKLPLLRYKKVYEGAKLEEPGTYAVGSYDIAPKGPMDRYYFDKEWTSPVAVYGYLNKGYNKVTAYFDTKEKPAQAGDDSFMLAADKDLYGKMEGGRPYMLKVIEKKSKGDVKALRYYKDPAPKELAEKNPVKAVYSVKDGKFINDDGAEKELITPASVEKIYTVYYATTILDLEEKVFVDKGVLSCVKEGSSLAGLAPGHFRIKELIAGMMVPSGNDAALALAVAASDKRYGKKLEPATALALFSADATYYLRSKGLKHTRMSDPSGYDYTDVTTPEDMNKVVKDLIKQEWFTDIIKDKEYKTVTPDKDEYFWNNTNAFLYPESQYYNKDVKGVKTGSLEDYYNLASLYYKGKNPYLIYVFGEPQRPKVFQDTTELIKNIN